MASAAQACVALRVVLLTPALEEAFFRGYLLPTLTRWVPLPAAVAASSLAFAAAHFASAPVTAQAVAGGLVFSTALVAARGNLAAPLLAHVAYNAVEVARVAAAVAVAGEVGG